MLAKDDGSYIYIERWVKKEEEKVGKEKGSYRHREAKLGLTLCVV